MAKKELAVGVKIDGNAKGFKSAADDAKKATAALKKQAAMDSREMERQFKMVTMAMAKVAAAFIVAKKAYETYGKIMNSTNATGDAFAIQQEKIKFANNELARSLATLDFSGLGKRMKEAVKAGEDLAKQMDLIFDLSLRLKLIESGSTLEMANQELIFKNKKFSDEVRIKAAEKYLEIVRTTEEEKLKFAQEEVKAALQQSSIAASGMNEERLKFYIQNADLLALNEQAVKDYLEALKTVDYWEGRAAPKGDIGDEVTKRRKAVEEASDAVKNFAKDYQQWMLIIDPERQGLTDAWAKLDAVMLKAVQDSLKPLADVGSLLSEAADDVETISKNFGGVMSAASGAATPGRIGQAQGGLSNMTGAYIPPTDGLQQQMDMVNALNAAFADMFLSVGDGFKGMVDSMLQQLKRLVAELLAKAAVLGILTALFPGSGMAIKALGAFKNTFGSMMPKLADGGIVSGRTTAVVGEYAGVKSNPEVIAPLNKLKSILGSSNQNITVVGRIAGRNIDLVQKRYNDLLIQST